MSARLPLIVVHRRNKIEQLKGLPQGCWIEIDIEIYEGKAYLTHDSISSQDALPDRLDEFVPEALKNGVAGFVVDCKRECAEKIVRPILDQQGVKNYFYLNEMEVQADIFQFLDPEHRSGIRVWKYRGAQDIIRMAEEMTAIGGAFPKWIWLDCWQRGLLDDIMKAYLPMTSQEAQKLQSLGVKLCICSPELYVHKYDTLYDKPTLAGFYRGTLAFRQKLLDEGIEGDSICTKFPRLWLEPMKELVNAPDIAAQRDFLQR